LVVLLHSDTAALTDSQHLKGVWKNEPDNAEDEIQITVSVQTEGDAVFGQISSAKDPEDFYGLDHIHLSGGGSLSELRARQVTERAVSASGDLPAEEGAPEPIEVQGLIG
jgi:hypothetical protein